MELPELRDHQNGSQVILTFKTDMTVVTRVNSNFMGRYDALKELAIDFAFFDRS
jgi:hypothetical protein